MLPAIDTNLSLSFAPDGTEIAGQPSSLAATFNTVASESEWQSAVLRAFQTWAVQTNGNIGLTDDSGAPFGAAGGTYGDERFGEIRVGARPLHPGVAAISLPLTSVSSGSWVGDVVFNSDFAFESVDDIFAVALHEAGNVFGLEDSSDPSSPLFSGGVPTSVDPTPADLDALLALHGVRSDDFYERDAESEPPRTDNDSFENAAQLKLLERNDVEGALPVIVYGDIHDGTDLDFFKLQVSGDYSGPLRFQVFTSGYSSLAARVTVFSETRAAVGNAAVISPLEGDAPPVQINVAPDETYYVRVEGNAANVFGSGGYSLVAVFEDINMVSADEIAALADGRYARLHPETLEKLLSSDDDFVDEDEQENEEIGQAVELNGDVSFPNGTRYLVHGSISNEIDKDVYKIKTPETAAQPVMTIAVQSLEAGQLVPRIAVYDGDEAKLAAEVISNGGGVTIVQVAAIESDAEYFVEVRAADNRLFRTGNYRLTVDFGRDAVQLDEVAEGSLDAQFNRNEHALYVAKPQVFHFLAEVLPVETAVPSAVRLEITDPDDHLLMTITTLPGETRSGASVLLLPGTYQVSFQAATANGQPPTAALAYALRGTVVSDPLAIELDDPLNQPFPCPPPNGDGAFCYPDGTATGTPFNWDDFVNRLFSTQSLPGAELVSSLNADWWSWYWATGGSGAAPVPASDTYQLTSNSILNTTGVDGVLGNDVDPENNPLLAVLETPPANGTLFFADDGSFTYLPDEGFQGTDQFAYRAFDLGSTSDVMAVFLEVFASGDFDFSGSFDASDIDTLASAIRTNDQSDRYDLNGDLAVDMDDHAYLINATIGTFPGDANLDFQVDAGDLDAWRGHAFSVSTGWATGDFNADGAADGSDFNLWNMYRFDAIPAATTTTGRTPHAPLATRVTAAVLENIEFRMTNHAEGTPSQSRFRLVTDLIMAGHGGLERTLTTSRHGYYEIAFRLDVTATLSKRVSSTSRESAQLTDLTLASELPTAILDVFQGPLAKPRPATL